MTDVFDAMKAHIDAITEHQVACEIEIKARADLDLAGKWYASSSKAANDLRHKSEETEDALEHAVCDARKATPKTGE